MAESGELQADITRSDELYETSSYRDVLAILSKYADSDDPEVLWRLMRIYYRVGKNDPKSAEEAMRMADAALACREKVLVVANEHFFCQKWCGIMLSWASELKGQKEKIEKSFVIRDHFLKGIELKPEDHPINHMMGRWCYQVASVSWLLRRMASMIFSTPPTSSYEEALKYFEEAERVQPDFLTLNWLWLGKCYLQLGRKDEAKKWLTKAAENQRPTPDDKEAREEALPLLRKI